MEKRETETGRLEERIAALRRQKGLSQERVAEHLGVSRQAVAKWESGQSRPSTDNLIRLAAFFQVDLAELLVSGEPEKSAAEPAGRPEEKGGPDQTGAPEISAGRAPRLFLGISFLCIAVYLLVALRRDTFQAGVLIGLVILAVPCQLFLHVWVSLAVRGNSFVGLAGFDSRISYHMEEVRRLAVQIDLHTGMLTAFYVFLITVTALAGIGGDWMFGILILLYAADFTAVILFQNYRRIDRLYRDEADRERARRGMPGTILYLILLFGGTAALCLCFAVRGLENNTVPALKVTLCLLLGIGAATAGYALEAGRIRKWDPTAGAYQRGRGSLLLPALGVLLLAAMFFV